MTATKRKNKGQLFKNGRYPKDQSDIWWHLLTLLQEDRSILFHRSTPVCVSWGHSCGSHTCVRECATHVWVCVCVVTCHSLALPWSSWELHRSVCPEMLPVLGWAVWFAPLSHGRMLFPLMSQVQLQASCPHWVPSLKSFHLSRGFMRQERVDTLILCWSHLLFTPVF